jgi:hypothetical protein
VSSRAWGIVLDSDVFLRASARDLFLYLAALEIVDPLWSERIMDEAARNFRGGRERFVKLRVEMEEAFPGALKGGFEHRIAELALTSEADRHVLALAVEYEADLVSFNHRDYDPMEAKHYGVTVWTPDAALEFLIERHPEEVEQAVRRAYLMLRKPPVRWIEYIEHVRADGMPIVAAWASGLPEPPRAVSHEDIEAQR